jgi:hypothetical protein
MASAEQAKATTIQSLSGTSSAQGREAAEYIVDLLYGAREMAEDANLVFLSYLIDLAREEAIHQSKSRV